MRVLGVDPGLTRCGIGVVDAQALDRLSCVSVSVARSTPGTDQAVRVRSVAGRVKSALDEFQPDAVAIERVFSQHNLATVMGVAQVTGAVMYLATGKDIPVILYTPTQVKAAISGYGGAEKLQVQRMVARVLRLDELPRPADAADALAIAICHIWNAAGTSPTPESVSGGVATDSQRKWREAESRARSTRGGWIS